MSAKDKRVAVLVADMYQELEFWYPYLRLKEEGASVVAVGPEKREYKSRLGYPVPAELAAAQVRTADFEAVVIPGGYAPDYMRRSPALVSFVREMAQVGKPVAAICHGGVDALLGAGGEGEAGHERGRDPGRPRERRGDVG